MPPLNQLRFIAIGASTGGIEALKLLAAALPKNFPAAIAIVNHLAPESPGYLPDILSSSGHLPTNSALDQEPIRPGRIYVAPPDRHLLIRHGRFTLSQGARENRVRPAIDPLFRSAAVEFGNRTIGVVLTGALDDGTAGLAAIKGCGGITVVQDPADAAVASMPESALRHVVVDHVVPIDHMAALLVRLVEQAPPKDLREIAAMKRELELELKFAAGEAGDFSITKLGEPSLVTCPECRGMLVELYGKPPLRFRCHTGHAFTAANLVAALREKTEDSLWSSIRSFQESALLLRHVAEHGSGSREPALRAELEHHAAESEKRAVELRALLIKRDLPMSDAALEVATSEAES